jgi:hypothetical protein
VGRWPWCPHETPRAAYVIDDELPNGPYLCETLGHEPVYVTSKSDLRRKAAERGLECTGGRHDDAWHAKNRKMHDERLRDEARSR